MRSITRLALAALCLAGTGLATAASFDCAKAGNATEKAICADPGLSRQDEALAALYLRQLETPDAGQWAAFLRRDQRDWIAVRNRECKGDTQCLKQDYERRIAFLGQPLLPWTGRYVQGQCPQDGRFLDVTPGDGGALDVEIYVCPDPRGNMLLQARDVLDAGRRMKVPDGGRCTRTFQFSADRITVADAPDCTSSLAGTYVRDPRRSPFKRE
ncbi:lysozyme inhibitor LprI family protein [Variovorax boronicumulans]|uniref:lysozyme inhibitor LprI family protein n=1 Tax=Variovorax boronicumulans TaxID=436515 RepID=UPI0033985B9B